MYYSNITVGLKIRTERTVITVVCVGRDSTLFTFSKLFLTAEGDKHLIVFFSLTIGDKSIAK